MNTISAMTPAQLAPVTAGVAPVTAQDGSAGVFLGLLGALLDPGIATRTVPANPGGGETAPIAESGADSEGTGTATAAEWMAASLAAMQPVLAVAVGPRESATAESTAIAITIDAAPVDAVAEVLESKASTQTVAAPDQNVGGELADKPSSAQTIAVQPSGATPAGSGVSLENMIQAAAASIGQSAGRAFAGRRFDGPAVAGPRQGSALEAIEGEGGEAQPSGFARVPLEARADAGSRASAALAGEGEASGSASLLTGETSPKPQEGFKVQLGADARTETSVLGSPPQSKPGGEIVVHRSEVPESVSVREVGDVVVRSVRYLSGKTEEVVTVRLVPRSLGELQIAVRRSGDGVEVVLTAANAAARDVLESHAAGLRESLAREGVEAPRVTIQVAAHFDASHQAPLGQSGQQGASGQAPRHAPAAYREPFGSGAREQEQEQPRRQRHDGRLNTWA